MLTIGLSVAGTAALYRVLMHVLGKGTPGSLANGLFKILGGGGPGEEPPPKK